MLIMEPTAAGCCRRQKQGFIDKGSELVYQDGGSPWVKPLTKEAPKSCLNTL